MTFNIQIARLWAIALLVLSLGGGCSFGESGAFLEGIRDDMLAVDTELPIDTTPDPIDTETETEVDTSVDTTPPENCEEADGTCAAGSCDTDLTNMPIFGFQCEPGHSCCVNPAGPNYCVTLGGICSDSSCASGMEEDADLSEFCGDATTYSCCVTPPPNDCEVAGGTCQATLFCPAGTEVDNDLSAACGADYCCAPIPPNGCEDAGYICEIDFEEDGCSTGTEDAGLTPGCGGAPQICCVP